MKCTWRCPFCGYTENHHAGRQICPVCKNSVNVLGVVRDKNNVDQMITRADMVGKK